MQPWQFGLHKLRVVNKLVWIFTDVSADHPEAFQVLPDTCRPVQSRRNSRNQPALASTQRGRGGQGENAVTGLTYLAEDWQRPIGESVRLCCNWL